MCSFLCSFSWRFGSFDGAVFIPPVLTRQLFSLLPSYLAVCIGKMGLDGQCYGQRAPAHLPLLGPEVLASTGWRFWAQNGQLVYKRPFPVTVLPNREDCLQEHMYLPTTLCGQNFMAFRAGCHPVDDTVHGARSIERRDPGAGTIHPTLQLYLNTGIHVKLS